MRSSTVKTIVLASGYLFLTSGCSKPAPPPHALDNAKDSARIAAEAMQSSTSSASESTSSFAARQ